MGGASQVDNHAPLRSVVANEESNNLHSNSPVMK